jgi:hypothetical protein
LYAILIWSVWILRIPTWGRAILARWTFYAILPRWHALSKWLQHLLHKCPLGNFTWRASRVWQKLEDSLNLSRWEHSKFIMKTCENMIFLSHPPWNSTKDNYKIKFLLFFFEISHAPLLPPPHRCCCHVKPRDASISLSDAPLPTPDVSETLVRIGLNCWI